MTAESEVERMLREVLKGTPFEHIVFSVGGYIRDAILGIESKDLDVVVEQSGGAESFANFLHKRFEGETTNPHNMGAGYPIWQITFKEDIGEFKTAGAIVEIADTQSEAFPDPESRQRITKFGTREQDVKRRDFSVNMLMRDMSNGELVDIVNGKKDIEDGVLKGHPEVDLRDTFSDDPLRMIRLVRFAVKYDWEISEEAFQATKEIAERIVIISGERIRDELIKMMLIGKLSEAIELMSELGLLKHILPEIEAMHGVDHDTSRGFHHEGNVWNHVLLVIKNAKPTVEAQLSALLHDVGKPKTQKFEGEKITFLGHEFVGKDMAEDIMRRLKFDNKTITAVSLMVESHMRPHAVKRSGFSAKAIRKLIRKIGDENMEDLLDLAEADCFGNLPVENYIPDFRDKLEEIRNTVPVSKKPVVSGGEIIELLNIEPSELIGEIIKFVKDREDDFASNGKKLTKEEAKELVLKEFSTQ